MFSDLTWNRVAELSVSCSAQDIDNNFEHTERRVHEIVDHTGLSTAQRRRLRTDIFKAALHGFSQIAKTGDCSYIVVHMYIKENGIKQGRIEFSDGLDQQSVGSNNHSLSGYTPMKPARDSGWGYFLIERIADRQEDGPSSSSYIIEVFLYREG